LAEIQWNKLGAYLKETLILGSIQNTLYRDQNTGMPKKGASWRSEQLTYIAKILHRRNSSEEFSNLIQSAKNELLDTENSNDQLFIRGKERNINLLIEEFNKAKNLDPKSRKGFPIRLNHYQTDISKIKRDLEWVPTFDLLNGLRDSFMKDFNNKKSEEFDENSDDILFNS